VKLPKRHQQGPQTSGNALAEQFPNEGIIQDGSVSEVHENNYFKDMPLEEVRNRYVKFSVFMTEVNQALDLENHTATIDQMAHRIRDLVYANQRKS